MIVVRLMGGLGNQMFQYAIARSLADRYQTDLKLDIFDYQFHKLRRYEIDNYCVRASIATQKDLDCFGVKVNRFTLRHRIFKQLPNLFSGKVFCEKSLAFNSGIFDIEPPAYLDGYWQSEEYFIANADAIRRDFSLVDPLDESNQIMLDKIKKSKSVSLHIRRGDYVNNDAHGVCSADYYRKAVRYVAERINYPHLFVFSDDLEWVRDNLVFPVETTFVSINDNTRGIFDMMLMQNCEHHIIANSSFSWWGAWLNPSPQKIVVSPVKWFRDTRLDDKDIIPTGWIRI